MREAAGKDNGPEVRKPDGRALSKADGGVWQLLSPLCAGGLRCDENGNSASKCGLQPHRAFDSLDAAATSTTFCVHQSTSLSAHSSHYSLLFSFRSAIHVFLLLKLAFSWASTARISPPLLGSSSPSTCSVGTEAYRQKAILPASYQASPEIYEGVDCKDDSPRCFIGVHNPSFAHAGTKIAEMIQ